MSAAVKLGSKLPGEVQINGVDAIADELVEDPEQIRVALVYFDVRKIEDDTDSGARVPTIRVRRFEPIGTLEDAPQSVRDVMAKAFADRTGQKPIPWEIATAEQIPRPADPNGDELPEDDDA